MVRARAGLPVKSESELVAVPHNHPCTTFGPSDGLCWPVYCSRPWGAQRWCQNPGWGRLLTG